MKTINRYMIYLYIPIIIVLIVTFIAFLRRLRETSKKAASLTISDQRAASYVFLISAGSI